MMVWAALVVNARCALSNNLMFCSIQAQHSTITSSCLLDFGELF